MNHPLPKPPARRVLALAATLAAGLASVQPTDALAAPISLTSPSSTYSQSFDSLASTGTSAAWANDSTLPGWWITGGLASTGNVTTMRVGDGSSNVPGALFTSAYSVGSAGSSERALGGLSLRSQAPQTSSFNGFFYLALTNNTGEPLSAVNVLYDSEQWLNGAAAVADQTRMSYRLAADTTFATSGFTAMPATFTGVAKVFGGTRAALNGNAAANRTADVGGSFSLNWQAGQTLWLRWNDDTPTGGITPDSLMAIDNLRISVTPVTAVPEPATYATMAAGLALLAGVAAWRRRGA